MNIKAELKKRNEIVEKFSAIKQELRIQTISCIKAILERHDEKIDGRGDAIQDYNMCCGSVCVTYDGGRHPEYASNAYSEVYGAFIKDNRIYLDCEDSDEYDIDRIWNVDELTDVLDFLIWYDENEKDYLEL